MNTITETFLFSEWFDKLRDLKGKMRILARVNNARAGNFGDYKVLEDGICEMRMILVLDTAFTTPKRA